MLQKSILIALGGNLPTEAGGPQFTLQNAIEALGCRDVTVNSVSQFYATPCFPKGSGPDYVNAAAAVSSHLTPTDFLTLLHEVEAEFGREREERWGRRTLDLDLLAFGNGVLPDLATYKAWFNLSLEAQIQQAPETLILPHPRMHERAFVLVPLFDVAPDWHHPVLNRSVSEMLADLAPSDVADVVPV